jgi:GPH family glycoside/pentoside/hexuronide:cation symporter
MRHKKTKMIHIPLVDKIAYGMGNLTYGIVSQMIGTYMVFYSTAVLGISGAVVGTAVSISVLWDAISDPLMGYYSDITKSKIFGRRHLYILVGCITLAIFNFLIWAINPAWSNIAKVSAVFVLMMLIKTAATVYATPYTALGAELSNDYNERTSVQGIRTIFFLLGLMFATVMGFLLFFKSTKEFPVGQLNPAAYRNMGLTVSIIAIVFGLVCFFKTKKYIPHLPVCHHTDTESGSMTKLIGSFVLALKNASYRNIVIAYLLTNISSALISTLGIHVFTYTFKLDSKDIGIIFGVLFTVSILSQPLWVRISAKIDKKGAVILGLLLSTAGSIMLLVFVFVKDYIAGQMLYMLPFAAIAGFGAGALFSVPYSMIADTIDVDELKTGVRLEGVYYGSLTFFYKFSQAITIFILGMILDFVKFNSEAKVQPESTVMILGLTIAVGGIIVLSLAGLIYSKYDLNREKITEIQSQIAKRNAEEINDSAC